MKINERGGGERSDVTNLDDSLNYFNTSRDLTDFRKLVKPTMNTV